MPINTLQDLATFFAGLPEGAVITVRKQAGQAIINIRTIPTPVKQGAGTGVLGTALSDAVDRFNSDGG